MALRPDRNEHLTDLSFFMNETAERGVIVTAATQGSGAAMDDSAAAVQVANAIAEKPVGLLLNDVVNLDLTRQHLNFAKDEVQQGSKVLLLRVGTVTTDQISGSITMGAAAHFMSDGTLTTGATTSIQVGRFLSKKDADGFAKVAINIQ